MLSPDIGVSEMLVVAIVALIVVGPKDLPLLLRRLGQFIAKLRGMANEFRASFEDMARQSELEELRKEVEAIRSGQFTAPLKDAADAVRDPSVDQVFADIDASLKGGQATFSPAMASQPAPEELPAPAKAPRKPRAEAAEPAAIPAAPAKRKVAAKAQPAKAAAKPAPAKSAAAKAAPVKAAPVKAIVPVKAKAKPAAKSRAAESPVVPVAAPKPRRAKTGAVT
jgi:sec-independent protein translocase protein TatB